MKTLRFLFLIAWMLSLSLAIGAERGLEFLSGIPDLRDLSLKMTEDQLKSHLEQHRLYSRNSTQNGRVTYWILTAEGENVFVGFADGKCTGIQRMQPIPRSLIEAQIGSAEYRAWKEKEKTAPNEVNPDLTKQVSEILTECGKVVPGTTRAELLKVFTTEGGLSTAAHRTFVHRRCPCIKVDVDFTLSDPKQTMTDEKPTDVVSKISRPYLAWSIMD